MTGFLNIFKDIPLNTSSLGPIFTLSGRNPSSSLHVPSISLPTSPNSFSWLHLVMYINFQTKAQKTPILLIYK